MAYGELERQGVRAHPGRRRHIDRLPDTVTQRMARSSEFVVRHIYPDDVPEVSARLEKLFLLYGDIANAAENMDALFYPAGSADAFPVLLSDNLVIIDRAPLFNPLKPRSETARRIVVGKNRPVGMYEIAAGTHGRDAREALQLTEKELHVYAILALNNVIRMGYETFGKEDDRGEDNFAHMLANLGILGIDLAEVSIRKLPGCYRISFPFEGHTKNIFYVQEEFPDATIATREERMRKARAIYERIGITGRIGIMKKADLRFVSEGFIEELDPEVIIMDTIASVPRDLRSHYDITELSDQERYAPLVRFGYKSQKEPRIDVQIAIKQ